MSIRWSLVIAVMVASLVGVEAARAQGRRALEPKDGLVCILVNRNSGRCLSVAGKSKEPGAKIVQGPLPAEAGPSEQWKLLASGDAFRLRNEHSGLVLEIGSNNMNRGVQAIQWHDQTTLAQQHWTFEPMDDAYVLRAGHSQLVLGVAMSKLEPGARVIQWNYVPNVSDQMWQLRPTKEDDAAAEPEAEERGSLGGWLLGAVICVGAVVIVAIVGGAGVVLHMRRRSIAKPADVGKNKVTGEPLVTAACTGCGSVLKIKPNLIGRKVKCSKCGTIVRVPQTTAQV